MVVDKCPYIYLTPVCHIHTSLIRSRQFWGEIVSINRPCDMWSCYYGDCDCRWTEILNWSHGQVILSAGSPIENETEAVHATGVTGCLWALFIVAEKTLLFNDLITNPVGPVTSLPVNFPLEKGSLVHCVDVFLICSQNRLKLTMIFDYHLT